MMSRQCMAPPATDRQVPRREDDGRIYRANTNGTDSLANEMSPGMLASPLSLRKRTNY